MRIVFRADSSPMIGSGHVMRCLALAHELTRAGATIHFVTAAYDGHLGALIRKAGFMCHEVVAGDESLSMDHRLWTADAVSCHVADVGRIVASIGTVDWLVVDHYGLDARFETACRDFVKRVAVIDDLANRPHDASLLLDRNLFEDADTRYRDWIPSDCRTLLGPSHALLRDEFRLHRAMLSDWPALASVQRVMAFFGGGGDSSNETEKFLLGWRESASEGMSADVVVGGSNPHIARLRSIAETMPNVRIHHQTKDMAKLMAASDYAFGASGSANWERLCLGLNASVVSVADNQVQTVRALARQGLVDYLGCSDETSASTYAHVLHRLNAHPAEYLRPTEHLTRFVDGLGARRVAHAILGTTS